MTVATVEAVAVRCIERPARPLELYVICLVAKLEVKLNILCRCQRLLSFSLFFFFLSLLCVYNVNDLPTFRLLLRLAGFVLLAQFLGMQAFLVRTLLTTAIELRNKVIVVEVGGSCYNIQARMSHTYKVATSLTKTIE
eukprot:TRINITY_DN12480_c3_g1_i1.p1 TRINITY_DN12480_c3_g1~~TRINITY_DN12480_c3_g1_i1.p1  ORF type:complete len:138 (-),score=7.79 TRINITY_DN12480_c3_g1_i1:11-424(-)